MGKGCIFFHRVFGKSPDKALGSITNIFPRFEFQTSKGNAPHLHILIWTVEKKDDPVILEKVLGSMRQLSHELKIELSRTDPSNSQVSSMIDVNNLLSLASSVLSHSCEKASFRCHKKCDKTSQMICRFNLYEPCSETFFNTVDRSHSTEVWDILIELGLATFVEESGSYIVCKPL